MKRLLFAVAVVACSARAAGEWTPPVKPTVEQADAILTDAISDTRNGNYQVSLAKYVWCHSHSFEFKPELLTGWYELAKAYPPAMVKLKETRDAETQRVIDGNGDVRRAFEDIAFINKSFDDEARTASLFLQLDEKSPSSAKKVYDFAQASLVKAKEHKVCGKYLDAKDAFDVLKEHRRQGLGFNAQKKEWQLEDREHFDETEEAWFLQQSAILVALLKLNGRGAEAHRVRDQSGAICKHPKSKAVLDAALSGQMPELDFVKFRQ